MQSHPSWVCGLKRQRSAGRCYRHYVTPFVGVWIETELPTQMRGLIRVTPFVGVWIETRPTKTNPSATNRHTLRGCVD